MLIDVEITAGRITFEGRTAAMVVSHDVSDRRRLERRLADAEKMEAIGRLAGGVAHDFNNLLTVIAGYAEILLAREGGEELEEISRAARQAAALTRQLLAFSRRQVLHPKILDLNEIVSGMETMLHRIIGDDISVGIRLLPELASVEADRAQIERVILNLAANARTSKVASRLAIGTRWAAATTAFATRPEASVDRAADQLRGRGARRLVIAPGFLAPGLRTDGVSKYAGNNDIAMASPLGAHRLVAETVLDRFDEAQASDAAA